ncbi:hypothetical protein [Flavobacterium sp. AG291]|uniref:hypothetical protein n=1 Tax=Flavobacterium sp. AG291 TaxID=2184000 RepID=UPI000E0C75AB|nr:hypothetical protein [Flavobacterium sp. AG291]RDI07062.1 hypothetical protein DEU42_113162 [Flavobacterium sp. AG291]
MDTREITLKPLPQCATKAELMNWYLKSNYTADMIRKSINQIIADTRGLPIDKAKFVKNIRAKELTLFVKEFDVPVGYKL